MCQSIKNSTTTPVGSVVASAVEIIADCEVIVNATSVGMNTSEHPCDVALIDSSAVVMDAVYSPLRTSWLNAAEAQGAVVVDGLWMLIHQAMRQQEWWFGVTPDPTIMRMAAERELAHRRQ
jgi:shikimate dehydrogenase